MSEISSRPRNHNLNLGNRPQLYSAVESGEGETEKEEDQPVYAAIYARTSPSRQRYNYSIDEQVDVCWNRCDQMNWAVKFVHKEKDVSADPDRPRFLMMMDQARHGLFDVIVFWKLDRLFRSLIHLLETEKQLREFGVGLHSVTEYIDTTTAVGRFNFRNLASAAELERDMIKERSRMGMHALAKQHKWPNPYPPTGYNKKEDGRLAVNEEEAELVRRVFLMYIDRRSMPQVAFELNEEGIKTKRGKEWSAWSVKKILDNEIYIGEYSVAGVEEHVEEYRVLEDTLFERVHEVKMRFKNEKKEMPEDRRKKKIDRVFDEYSKFLDEMEEDTFVGSSPEPNIEMSITFADEDEGHLLATTKNSQH